MKVITTNSTTYSPHDGLTAVAPLADYLPTIQTVATANTFDAVEASMNLPFAEEILQAVQTTVSPKLSATLRYIFVVGIGGSNLGTKAIYDALYGYQDIEATDRPKLIFIDTNNTSYLQFCIDTIIASLNAPDEYLLFTISKSGGTTETLANTEILLAALENKLGDMTDRTIVITDSDSKYQSAAKDAGMAVLTMPPVVGGRYSVFSAVGLAPLYALGLDVEALLQGARDIRPYCLRAELADNPAAVGAGLLVHALQNGKTINDTFVFNGELESLGKWYRQLLGESIGKEYNQAGELVQTGITPTVSVGSTDLHSVGQLYLGGPKDKLTTFVYSLEGMAGIPVPTKRMFSAVVDMIAGKTTTDIMQAILNGAKVAYNQAELPFMEVVLEAITPYELGAFMQYKMLETMYVGRLLGVNPFDQPNVESYKLATKQQLES